MNMFDTVTGLMPHGVCFFYRQDLILMHVISDGLIALADFSIPVTLLHVLRKRKSIPFAHVLVLFAAFIMLCGLTHIMGIWTIWKPYYFLEGGVKVLTAAISVLTAIALVPLVPKALAMRTPEELEAVNAQLREQIAMRDAAEQRTQETLKQLEASNHELEQFAYVASHDLQAPLRSIKGFSDLLGAKYKDQLGEEGGEYLQFIADSAGSMQTLIDDLLALSRVDQGALDSHEQATAETLDAALSQLDADIKSSGAQVTYDELPTLTTEHNLLQQVFQNLLSNGIKFQPPGQAPKIHVSAARTTSGWEFSVRDNGIGIPKDKLDSVFQIFKRLHAHSEYAGNGIGLALIQRIVKRLGGTVAVDSQQGGKGSGTTVTFSITEQHEAPADTHTAGPFNQRIQA